jgi:phenylacetate-CoA ligase
MLPLLSRHLFCPLHEWALRRSTFRYLHALEWSQWNAPVDLRRLQARKLGDLLRHAKQNVPYYRRLLEQTDVDRSNGDPLEWLSRLPLLDKATIRANIKEMLWSEAPGGLYQHNTGGSSGEPLIFYFDRRRQGYDQAARIRTHRWFGVDIGDRELYLWGSPIEHSRTNRMRRIRDRLFNHRLVDAFNMSPDRMDQYLEEFSRYRPTCLFGYPSSLALLAEHALTRGVHIDARDLRVVFVTGEVCYPHHRQVIAEYFRVPVADGYGSREGGFIAHECPEGNLHITAENVVVEIVENGEVVPSGQDGEIVITHLDAYGMPFIRYRTGDRGRLKEGRCPCGRGLPMMDVIQGRATDFLYLPDGTIKHALSVIYPLREMKGIRRFCVMQSPDYSTRVLVVPEPNGQTITTERVARRLRRIVDDQVDINVQFVDRIPITGSGKYRYVMSEANPAHPLEAAEATHG